MNTPSNDAAEIHKAAEFFTQTGKCSTSALQRHFAISYNRAARIVEELEEAGIVSAPNDVGKRYLAQTHIPETIIKAAQNLAASGASVNKTDSTHPHKNPRETGYYWAKLIHPHNEPAGEDWRSSDWEIVQVDENYGEGEDEFRVYMLGIEVGQLVNGFIWGPAVTDKTPTI
ncbi:DNA translocase FtsK [uncultured Sulfitobacter sp.]|uniref:DNA translocase FtsK n=1 Tax=uncultured Sulfitobacter sp. TaxID=191468 RepID=UPI0026038424|nr:DNA translocase FtsK [uncultured Sulfitobacter sp.]